MAKLTLATITSGYASVDRLNANFDLIEAALENTLSRDGTSPNSMEANLDMNTHRILNLPPPQSAGEPLRLGDLADGAGTLLSQAAQNAADAEQSAADASVYADDAAGYAAAALVSQQAAEAAAQAAEASASEAEGHVLGFDAVVDAAELAITNQVNTAQSDIATQVNDGLADIAAQLETTLAALLWQDVVFLTNADSPFTVVEATHRSKLFAVDASGGPVTINLPAVSSLSLPFQVGVKKIDSSENAITIVPNGTDTVDGDADKTIEVANAGAALFPDTDPSPDRWTSADFGPSSGGGGGSVTFSVDTFSGDGVEDEFVLTTAPSSENNVFVFISGVYQQVGEYSLTGDTLTFTTPPPTGTNNVQVRYV